MTETATPPTLPDWIADYQTKAQAIAAAVEAFTRHLAAVPDPRSAEEVAALLHWRLREFRMDPSPANQDERKRAAEIGADFLTDLRRRVQCILVKMLEGTEFVLSLDAKDCKHGLFAPDLLPAESTMIAGGSVYLVRRQALPEGHPLHTIPDPDPRLPTHLYLCPGQIGFRQDGRPARYLPEWCTLSSVRSEAERQRGETLKQEQLEAQRRREREQEDEWRRLRQMTEEQRVEERLRRVEQQLAARDEGASPCPR